MLSTVPKCPLVINTPGWILGTGLEILVELIKKCRPTEVIYMSQDGPQEVVEALREAAKTTPVITLPSQGSEYTTRTAAHLRTMQAMSYFHLNRIDQDRLTWDDRPLASVPPWEIKYSGEASGILGIMCYGEQPPPSLLLEAINGSLLAVVVVEDKSAIPGWDASPEDEDPEDGVLKALDPSDLLAQSRQMQTPLILHTPNENIPYFNPANAISLSPKHSHCLGLALLRGVDVPRQRLQILTPISPKVIQEINNEGKSIVLVSGKFDTPGWAYIEELVQSDVNEKESRKTKSGDSEGGLEGDEGTLDMINKPDRKQKGVQDVPWVDKLQGSQGRGIGARVWRVRRDLGRDAGGE
jgi:polynucleotide 5'-hydroxyl-kinase GRC3/NOL9